MITDSNMEETPLVHVPDDHRDEVMLLPESQQPFEYCEVDRRVQSVFFHHDIKKEIAWQFFEYVGTTLMSYKIIDLDTDNGRALFQTATAAIDNSIEVEKIRLAVRRLGCEDPFAALSKVKQLCSECHCPKRNGKGEEAGRWKKTRREEENLNSVEGKSERPDLPPLEVKQFASNEEGIATYECSIELPPLQAAVRKLDGHPGYARRLRIVSSPKKIEDDVLRDFSCRFGNWIRIYQSGRNPVAEKHTAFTEFGTVKAAEECKNALDGQSINGSVLEVIIETPKEIDQKNKRFAHKKTRMMGPPMPLMKGGGGYGFGGNGFGGNGYGGGFGGGYNGW